MPRWKCSNCKRYFKSTHHFLSHIKGQKNTACRLRYEQEIPKTAADYYINPEPRLNEDQPDQPEVEEPIEEESMEEPGQPGDQMDEDDGFNFGNDDDESAAEPTNEDPAGQEQLPPPPQGKANHCIYSGRVNGICGKVERRTC